MNLNFTKQEINFKNNGKQYVNKFSSNSITNANIVYETKIRIIDILQVFIIYFQDFHFLVIN